MMHRNPFWIGFICIALICTLAYTFYTLYYVYGYYQLKQQENVQSIDWSVSNLGDEKYVPLAYYQFNFKDQPYQGESLLLDDYSINPFAAKEKIKKLEKLSFKVWFDPSNPNYSTIDKTYPLKESIYAISLWFLLLYFFGLDRYISNYYKN